jgi:glycerol kinase
MGALFDLIKKFSIKGQDIAAIGITNQRETVVVWDKLTGKPVYNAIVWQCRRTADICEQLKTTGYTDLIKSKTGLVVDAYFSGTKIKWILDNVKEAKNKSLLCGTMTLAHI